MQTLPYKQAKKNEQELKKLINKVFELREEGYLWPAIESKLLINRKTAKKLFKKYNINPVLPAKKTKPKKQQPLEIKQAKPLLIPFEEKKIWSTFLREIKYQEQQKLRGIQI